MTLDEIIASLIDQAEDKEMSINGDDPENIFARDARMLREAAELLRVGRSPVKLDRSRWEGCPFCRGKEDNDQNENLVRTRNRYCDVCGRPLTALAWIELELRIGSPPTAPYTAGRPILMYGR